MVGSPSQIIYYAIQRVLQLKVEKSKQYAQDIRDSIVRVAREVVQLQNGASKKICEEGRKLEKELRQRLMDLDKVGRGLIEE